MSAPAKIVGTEPGLSPAAFIADLIRADLAVLVAPSGELELFARRSRLNRSGDGYSDVPGHPDADRLAARFRALNESERAGIIDYLSKANPVRQTLKPSSPCNASNHRIDTTL